MIIVPSLSRLPPFDFDIDRQQAQNPREIAH
jgi:hypothetical protein